MKIIEKHGLDELILTRLLGWKWISFIGVPIKGTDNYPQKCRVRQLFSPKQLNSTEWQEHFKQCLYFEANGTEPLSYAYCSSVGPEVGPRLFILVDE